MADNVVGTQFLRQVGGQLATIEVRQEDKYGRADPMWPWNLVPGQGYEFSCFCLAVDLATVGILVLGMYFAFPTTARTRNRLQFSIKALFAVQALVCLLACLIVNFPLVLLDLAYTGVLLGVVFTLFTFGRTAFTIAVFRRCTGRTNNPQPQSGSPLGGAGPEKMVE